MTRVHDLAGQAVGFDFFVLFISLSKWIWNIRSEFSDTIIRPLTIFVRITKHEKKRSHVSHHSCRWLYRIRSSLFHTDNILAYTNILEKEWDHVRRIGYFSMKSHFCVAWIEYTILLLSNTYTPVRVANTWQTIRNTENFNTHSIVKYNGRHTDVPVETSIASQIHKS